MTEAELSDEKLDEIIAKEMAELDRLIAEANAKAKLVLGGPEGETVLAYSIPSGLWLMLQAEGRNLVERLTEQAHRAAQAARKAQTDADASGGTSGWVLVPREPTPEMIEVALVEAGWKTEPYRAPRESGVPTESDISQADADSINAAGREAMASTYRVMILRAAPCTFCANGNELPDGEQCQCCGRIGDLPPGAAALIVAEIERLDRSGGGA